MEGGVAGILSSSSSAIVCHLGKNIGAYRNTGRHLEVQVDQLWSEGGFEWTRRVGGVYR